MHGCVKKARYRNHKMPVARSVATDPVCASLPGDYRRQPVR